MRQLNSFIFLSLDGFYKDPHDNISWHHHGEEENQYAEESLKSNHILLFGRVTFEMMANFWTGAEAFRLFPGLAEGMNRAEKIVFSNTLQNVDWQHTTIWSGDILDKVKKLKSTPGKSFSMLGSGSIVRLFADAGLIDQYEVIVDPVAIGKGVSLFGGIQKKLEMDLIGSRRFSNGSVLLTYRSCRESLLPG